MPERPNTKPGELWAITIVGRIRDEHPYRRLAVNDDPDDDYDMWRWVGEEGVTFHKLAGDTDAD